MKYPTMRFDLKVLAVLFFIWAVLNFTDGVMQFNVLNIAKGVIGLVISGYMYFGGGKVAMRYYEE